MNLRKIETGEPLKIPEGKFDRSCANRPQCNVSTVGGNPVKFFTCAGCKCEFYCSKACQKEHWPIHKVRCKQTQEEISRLKRVNPAVMRSDVTPAQMYEELPSFRKHFDMAIFACGINALRSQLGDNPKKWHTYYLLIQLRRLVGDLSDRPRWARFAVARVHVRPATDLGIRSFKSLIGNVIIQQDRDSNNGGEVVEWQKYENKYGHFFCSIGIPAVDRPGINGLVSLVTGQSCDICFTKEEFDGVEKISNWEGFLIAAVESKSQKARKAG
ncbi:unnamed protein product [Somion occarium]|uniref:MYND-type domain-containing protein n=1 Tax=Somion occarium TaxID=3059160 RepID=A0ABP1ECM9_9APHY